MSTSVLSQFTKNIYATSSPYIPAGISIPVIIALNEGRDVTIVTIQVGSYIAMTDSSSTIVFPPGSLPQPLDEVTIPMVVYDNSLPVPGACVIDNAGNVTIGLTQSYDYPDPFTAEGSSGFDSFSISYQIA